MIMNILCRVILCALTILGLIFILGDIGHLSGILIGAGYGLVPIPPIDDRWPI
jgi:hypothetical protein